MLITTLLATALVIQDPATPAFEATRIKTFPHLRATSVAGGPEGSLFAVALEDHTVKIIDAKTLQSTVTLTGHPRPVLAMAFSPDGRLLATGDESARIWVWDVKTGQRVREYPRDRGHRRGIQALEYNHDGTLLASVGLDDAIKIWKRGGGHPVQTILGSGANFYGVEFSPGGGLYTATLAEGLRIYKPKSFELLVALPVPGGQGSNSVAIDPRATIGITADRSGNVSVFDLRARHRTQLLRGHMGWVMNAAISPNGRLAATSGNDSSVILWDLKTKQPLQVVPDQSVMGAELAFTGNGRYLITTNAFEQVQVHLIEKGDG